MVRRPDTASPPASGSSSPEVWSREPYVSHEPRRRRRRRRRSHARLFAVISVLLVLLIGGGGGGAYLALQNVKALEAAVRHEFTAAQADLNAGKHLLKVAGDQHDPSQIAAARRDFASAKQHFDRASSLVHSNGLIGLGLRSGPDTSYVQRRVDVVDRLDRMGDDLVEVANAGADIDQLLIEPGQADESAGQHLLGILRTLPPKLAQIQAALDRAQRSAAAVDLALLPAAERGSVSSALATISSARDQAQLLGAALPGVFDMLGGNGPRTYLIEQVNPAELRAGGGYMGSYSIITANSGKLAIVQSAGTETVPTNRPIRGQPGYVKPPAALVQFVGGLGWNLADSNFYPDFVSNAKEAEFFVQKDLNLKVDGVVSLDPYVISDLLAVTGAINVPGRTETFTADNVVQLVFDIQDGPTRDTSNDRKRLLGLLAGVLVEKLTSISPSHLTPLIGAFVKAASERHLQIYMNNAEPTIDSFGWSGQLKLQTTNEGFMDLESNFGGTKVNRFMTRTFDLTLTRTGESLHHQLVITGQIDNTPSDAPDPGQSYNCYTRLLLPASATGVTFGHFQGPGFDDVAPPPGEQVADGWLRSIPDSRTKKATWTLTAQWDTSWPAATATYTIYWEKQPGTLADAAQVHLVVEGRAVGTVTTDLGQDRELVLGQDRVSVDTPVLGSVPLGSLGL